jgi:hypothetical protein
LNKKSLFVKSSNSLVDLFPPVALWMIYTDNHEDICKLANEHALAYRKIVQICQTHGAGINGADPTRRKYDTTTMLCNSSTKPFTYQLSICRSKNASGR